MMNCLCADALDGYERISDSESILELDQFSELEFTPKAVELTFYNDDGSYKTALVDENLQAGDLCQLLALKNNFAKDVNWSIIEHLGDLRLERIIEDHEKILPIFISWGRNNKSHSKFFFRKEFRKYEFFHNPQQFFPKEMVDVDGEQECLADSPDLTRMITLQTLLANKDKIPEVSGIMWVREIGNQAWSKAYFVLSDNLLSFSYKFNTKNVRQMQIFADISCYNAYVATDGRKIFRAPSDFCFCLKPTVSAYSTTKNDKDLLCFCCETDRARYCWLTAMRITIYGSHLQNNFKNFKVWQTKSGTPGTSEYISLQVPSESVRTRVAMDFTGSNGKIIEDPLEAEAIAVAEGKYWNKKLRPFAQKINGGMLRGMTAGVHITQPWFHMGLSREEATQLLIKYGTVDGVFLVRNSRSLTSDFVLSFIYSGKVFHTRISLIEEKDQLCCSLDNGRTKFYDLLQLVEFYQLNLSCLPTKLTHYIVPSRGVVQHPSKQLKNASGSQD